MFLRISLPVSAILFVPAVSMAQTTAAEDVVNREDDSPAVRAFEEAKALFNAARYIEASQRFREADRLRSSWKLWFNIGQCEAAAKRNGLALEAFEKYAALGGDEIDADRRTAVMEEIARLQPIVGFLEVEAPDGATVMIDRMNRGTTPLAGPLMIAAAVEHEVIITGGNAATTTKTVKVAGGRTIKIHTSAVESGTGPSPAPQAETAALPAKSKLPPIGWTLFGVGAASLVAGTATGITALVKSNNLSSECPNQNCADGSYSDKRNTIEKLSVTTDVLLAVGGTVAVTGLVLALVGRKKNKKHEAAAFNLTPYLAPTGGGLFIAQRF